MTATITSLAGEYEGFVEPATVKDVARLAEMGEELHASSDHRVLGFDRTKVERLLTALINDPNGVVFVSRRDGIVVGAFAGAVVPNWFSDDLIGVDYSFFVLPDARNDMRGTTLILAFVRWCQRRGARQVRVGITTGIEVESTCRLYRSLGFVDAGVGFTKEV
jgi:GNAT superfamily N-acetyltransferase